MIIKLDHPNLLSKAVDVISELVTEVRLKFNEFGLVITAIDPANVAMVSFKLPRSTFKQYEVNNDILGINLDNLKQVLKRCGIGSQLIIEAEENTLKLSILDRIKRDFTLALLEVETEDKDLPNLEFVSKIELPSVDFIASIEDCGIVSDSCSFQIKDGNFIIEAKGLNSAKSQFSSDEIKIDAQDCKSKYSLEYLQKFLKASKLCVKTGLNFSNDYPLRMDCKTDQMEISFVLAPRVENDD